jgi:hypothetical protein
MGECVFLETFTLNNKRRPESFKKSSNYVV